MSNQAQRKRRKVFLLLLEMVLLTIRERVNICVWYEMLRSSNQFGLSVGTVYKILKYSKFRPYKLQTVQQLFEEDYVARLAFAHAELNRIRDNPEHLSFLVFSDEAHFHLNGAVNKHNFRYWSQTNPGWVSEEPLHSPKCTVWAAIWEGGTIGPFFFNETVNGERYLEMLQIEFLPELETQMMIENCIFMQDGAPPHWARNVRDWLN
jgi:hypothetical protein